MTKRILKKAGAKSISRGAQIKLVKILEKELSIIAKQAVKNAEYLGRKRVKSEDIKQAFEAFRERGRD